jgi:hypothetical protein
MVHRMPIDNEDERLAEAAADALVRDQGAAAYWEARRRERDAISPGTTPHGRTRAHWRLVALATAHRTGREISVDTATWRTTFRQL